MAENTNITNVSFYYNNSDNEVVALNQTPLIQPYTVVATILGTLGTVFNIFSIAAIFQVRYKWTSVFKLMLSLMLSDILISTSLVTLIFIRPTRGYVSSGTYMWCSFTTVKALFTMGMNITLLNLVAMAVDHFIAILYPLKYLTLLGNKRNKTMIITLWIIAFITGFSDYFSPLWNLGPYKKYTSLNFCKFIWITPYNEEYTTFVIALCCTCVMVPVYLKIYCTARSVKRNTTFLFVNSVYKNQKSLDRNNRNRRALITTLTILGTFVICWLPLCLFQVIPILLIKYNPEVLVHIFSSQTLLQNVDQSLICLLLLNPICDPVIYAIRIREVRHGFLKLLSKLAPLSSKLQQKLEEPTSVFNHRRYSAVKTSLLTDRRATQVSGLSITPLSNQGTDV